MVDDLSGLNALLMVAPRKSFTAAAAELRVTLSAVSQTIKNLEERVGVRLVQRTTRNVGLTEAGTRFVSRLKPALDGVHEAFESLGELRDRPAGTLRINMSRFAYTSIFKPRLGEFFSAYPDINLVLVHLPRRDSSRGFPPRGAYPTRIRRMQPSPVLLARDACYRTRFESRRRAPCAS